MRRFEANAFASSSCSLCCLFCAHKKSVFLTIAHQTGYRRNHLGQLERSEKSPSLNALFDFAASFGMKPSELLRLMELEIARQK
jgi:transcriptional regulator with XRE-family HTH domain